MIPLLKTIFCSPSLYESSYYQAHSCSWIVNKTLAVKSRYFILHATTICNLGRCFWNILQTHLWELPLAHFDIMLMRTLCEQTKKRVYFKKKSKTSGVVWPLSHNGMWNVLCCHKMYLGLDLYCISVCFFPFSIDYHVKPSNKWYTLYLCMWYCKHAWHWI